ncbi:unnamed protein product [Prorocentrum cordatum]|uniref:Protein translocase subunit SecA n=1 Tax=Prorocentrum cordatum TaxID=2364126 RepID=A0ABN9SB64_9DINO|nr:unnamed protein product [Polarella glacialis]
MKLKTEEFRAECEKKMREKEAEVARKTEEFKAVCEGLAKEKMEMNKQLAQVRSESEREAAAKQDMERRMAAHAVACEEKMKEKEEEMRRKTERNRAECEQLEKEKQDMQKQMQVFRNDCESRMAEEKVEMSKRTDAFFSECEKTMEANEKEMVRQTEEFNAERKKMDAERAELRKSMNTFRADSERKMAEEEAAMRRKMQELRAECQRKVAEEKGAAERVLREARQHTEEQLQKERAVTDSIMTVLRELPPLQAAMELGDLCLLEAELRKWRERDYSHFGECKGVVEAIVKLAQERLVTWRGVEHTWKDVLREVERLPGTQQALTQHSQRIFRALKESQLTKMDIRRSDPNALERLCEVILAWQAKAMSHCNAVQKLIVQKVVNCPRLGAFDFADLDICLRLVDRCESSNTVFLSRAQAIIEEPSTEPKDMRALLSHVETMLFFLKYAASEDLGLTHLEFRRQARKLEPAVAGYLAWAEREYPPGQELVRLPAGRGLVETKDVETVLEELRRPAPGMLRAEGLGPFREIFYQWAQAMHAKFDLLVLPHHTQVITLLAFKCFLEAEQTKHTPHSLIAQVGTGEGKSMIVAALAIYVAVVLGKKAHVVVDDETLLERDFSNFKRLFDNFEVPARAGRPKRPLYSVLCASADKVSANSTDKSLVLRVDPEADICYCEAKHVQSFYASIARGVDANFDEYKNRVLILDEVDALVIDEEPNEAFVYPNAELSDMATSIAGSLARDATVQELRALHSGSHPAGARVCSEMVKEWSHAAQMTPGEDFVFVKEAGKYCALQSGRANPKAWSLALECRNFQDGLSRDILFQERLFVMSRPRVFRKYSRILGLSGSIGSQPERDFLRDTYKASFFEVPPFLKTCRGSPFHEAVPASLGEQQKAVYVEAGQENQITRLIEVALEARERVPVLVVAKDRVTAEHVVERLRQGARSRGLGSASEDAVRSLSRTLYEADPEQWKENLNRATMPVGDAAVGRKAWRITVTDPRGGRGTDYRVDDSDVDAQGGLLLIPTFVPTSRRDWTQFLGRTARQDRRGQFCCVLNDADYRALSEKYNAALPHGGSTEAVSAVLNWGDQEAAGRIRGSAALYNTGVRVNELCEEVFSKSPHVLSDPHARERLVDICQRHRWMSVEEVTEAFARLPGLNVASLPTEAHDMGRPQEPPTPRMRAPAQGAYHLQALVGAGVASVLPAAPKVVVFCLDWSASMMSRDTRTPLSRFEMCQQSVQRILDDQVRDCDFVSVVGFGPTVETVIPPTPKGAGAQAIHGRIASLRPSGAGGTCFYDSVVTSLQLLGQPGLAPAEGMRWLVCLTDGDDLGSQRGNQSGEMVNHILNTQPPANLNMVMITVGPLREQNLRIMDSWVDRVSKGGGQGMRISEKDAVNITKAFDVVAECLAADVGGAVEC